MASTKEYLDFVMEQLSGLDELSSRAMMGEYILITVEGFLVEYRQTFGEAGSDGIEADAGCRDGTAVSWR